MEKTVWGRVESNTNGEVRAAFVVLRGEGMTMKREQGCSEWKRDDMLVWIKSQTTGNIAKLE